MIGCIIQARMGSSRLPGKAMKKIHDEIPILEFQQNQLKFSKCIDKIIIATTTLEPDDHIADFCKSHNLECFRGESEDVLDRYYQCAKKFNFPIIVRLTSDNPLIDPKIVDNVIDKFLNSKCDYISTEYTKPLTFPLGFAVEVFNFQSLEKAWKEAELPSEHEHVTPYIYKNPDKFKIQSITYEKNLSHIRCTVDTNNDFKLVEEVISKIDVRPIYLDNILELFKKEPNLLEINKEVKHDGYERSLRADEEFLKQRENHEK